MSFPGSFSSQLSSIMEALLKAVVAEVTALVEDGAVELRLELRDRERQILEKERDIEERDRVIEELRAAVEELTARGEEEMSPAEEEDRGEQTESCDWNKDKDDDAEVFIKHELTEEPTAAAENHHESLHHPLLLPSTLPPAPITAACAFGEGWSDGKHEKTPSCSQRSPDTERFSHFEPDAMPLDSLLNMDQEKFYSTQPEFSFISDSGQVLDTLPHRSTKKRRLNVPKPLDCGGFPCNQCGKIFTVKWRLTTHQSVHTGAKPYSCRKCGKKFSRRDNCARHEKSDARCKDSPVNG